MSQPLNPTITIRPAYADDDAALARLAALDSADVVPARPLLLAEVDGNLKTALSLADGTVIADPFHRTRELVALLRLHAAAQQSAGVARRRSRLTRSRRLRLQHGY
ncbi:MAG TPA: hypothetical protein VMU39_01045 [Solirubrobacteraceae bacterium]|nr:hypothetical protein [Solirubrobacteraceae bacterium]